MKNKHEILARGTAQVNTPNATVTDLCKLKPPFFAKDTTQVNTPNAIGIFAIGNLKPYASALCLNASRVAVVLPSTTWPYRPLGHIYQATTL